MSEFDKNALIKVFGCVASIMSENRDLLCKMDAEMGDGDLGLTMSKLFPAGEKEAKENEETDIGKLMVKCGMKMNSAAPSTMGTLLSFGFIAAGKSFAGKASLDKEDFANFYMVFADGLANRGKARRGDRTVLDALYPAADSATKAFAEGLDISGISLAALNGAREGLESTREMLPKFGKAAVFVDSAIGKIDQGAFAGTLFIEGIHKAVS